VQEAIIGVVYVSRLECGDSALAKNPRGGENLKELLIGQILWVNPGHLPLEALIYAAILALWFGLRERLGRIGFYVLFACAVTVSVQLVGLFLVFITLVVPALATFYQRRRRYPKAYAVGVLGLRCRSARVAVARPPLRRDDRMRHGAVGVLVAFIGRRASAS